MELLSVWSGGTCFPKMINQKGTWHLLTRLTRPLPSKHCFDFFMYELYVSQFFPTLNTNAKSWMQSLHNCIWQFQHLSTTYHLQNPVKADRLCFSITICPPCTPVSKIAKSSSTRSPLFFSTIFSAKKMSCLHCPQAVTTHTFCLETLPSKPEKRVTFPPQTEFVPSFFLADLTNLFVQNLKQNCVLAKKQKYSNNAARPQNTIQFIARISWKCRLFFTSPMYKATKRRSRLLIKAYVCIQRVEFRTRPLSCIFCWPCGWSSVLKNHTKRRTKWIKGIWNESSLAKTQPRNQHC